eukprot:CAMPEP_0181348918 /NCGR_PEP_ID=MMETSP1106-20121128/446_1 /TAXON_ID=81844 /ORGANISM="Mantoniella antarctica, Strain SL-175" /LENGTH=1640 /DNA_ID=CAMNT_0023461271 /DNA_START=149 /DNA_END=5073 /DNA_ORIENTATION=+
MGRHGGICGTVYASVVVSAVCVLLCCAASSASATASPLTLTSSTASPIIIGAYRPDTATAVVGFTNSGGTSAVSWFATASVPWVSFTTANAGSALAPASTASVTVSAAAAGLAKGDYFVTLIVGVAGGEELVVPLEFTVSSPLEISPATVTESCALGTNTSATITVTNRAATSTVSWAGVASTSWINASPASGASLAPGVSITMALTLGAGLASEVMNFGSIALADDGMDSEVALSVQLATRSVSGQSTVYVAGTFTSAGGVSGTKYLAKLYTGTSTWSALGVGISGGYGYDLSLLVDSSTSSLYVGGSFDSAGGVVGTNNIAKWNTASSAWGSMGTGVTSRGPGTTVDAIALDSSTSSLYVGSSGLAKWDPPSSTWSALGSGLYTSRFQPGEVRALALDSSTSSLYVGGRFDSALARWDTASSTWSALGGGVSAVGMGFTRVQALAFDSSASALYVGGYFTSAGNVSGTNHLANWDLSSSTWSALGSGLSGVEYYWMGALALALDSSTSSLYVGGEFTSAGGVSGTVNVARWDIASSTWSALGSGVLGPKVLVLALDSSTSSLYVGGDFNSASNVNRTSSLAKWDTASSTWNAIGLGGTGLAPGASGSFSVYGLAVVTPICAAGDVPTASGGACTPCYPGRYVKDYGSNRRECQPCPKNTVNAATLSATLAQCVACAPGTGTDSLVLTTCAQCSAGAYSDVAGEGCKVCSAGTSSTAVGATSASTCALCATGTAQPLTGKTSCDMCALGTSTTSPGGTTCTDCPTNTFTPQPGEPCSACGGLGGGWYRTATAAAGQTWGVACDKCPKGTATAAADVTAFGLHQLGTGRTGGVGSGACLDCPAGTFGAAAVNPTCLPCPANTFGDETKVSACKACPPGAASAIGSVQPSACMCGDPTMESGYSVAGILECACPRGTQIEGTRCAACPLGTYSGMVGSQACNACPIGASTNNVGSTNASQCICPRNAVLHAEGTSCICNAGFEGDLNAPDGQCTPCSIAKYKEVASTSLCSACPIGTTTTTVGARTPSACVCAAGTYLKPNLLSGNAIGQCLTCELLVGGACRGGDNLTTLKLTTLPGHWRAGFDTTSWHQCLNQQTYSGDTAACKAIGTTSCKVCRGTDAWSITGGVHDTPLHQCRDGYESRLCGVCSKGYSRVSTDYECGKCPAIRLNVCILVALGALVVFVIACLVSQTLKKKVGQTSGEGASILKVALNYLQVASFAAAVDFRWPKFMRDTLMATGAVSTPRSVLLSVDCLLQRSAGVGADLPASAQRRRRSGDFSRAARAGAWGAAASFAAAVAAIAARALVPRRWITAVSKAYSCSNNVERGEDEEEAATAGGDSSGDSRQMSNGIAHPSDATLSLSARILAAPTTRVVVVCLLVTTFTIYPTVMQETLLLFSCKELDGGKSFLLESMDLECGSARHAAAIWAIGVPGLLIYVVGIPVGLVALLYWRRNDLHASKPRRAQELLWFVYGDYNPTYFYWEGCLMLRKALVVAFTVTMVPYGVEMQAHMVLGLLFVAFGMQIALQPFASPLVNTLEATALGVLAFTFWVGLLSYDTSVREVPVAGELLSVFAFVCNLGFVGLCVVAYSRAALAKRLGVEEHAPLREFVGALLNKICGRGRTPPRVESNTKKILHPREN